MNCPRCNSKRIRRSHRRGVLERLLSGLGRWPYRCGACGGRFFRWMNASEPNPFRVQKLDDVQSQVKRDAECVARVVIRTEQHQQMDEILSALHRAVAEAQSRTHAEARR